MKAFMAALDSMGQDPLQIGLLEPTPGIVNKFFNDSTGIGPDGEGDERGPWNEGDGVELVESPMKMEAQVSQDQILGEIHAATGKKARTHNKISLKG